MENNQFWMVWNPERNAPTHRHLSKEQAEREAERLARANAGQRFYILQATAYREVETMRRVRLVEPEVPF